MTPLAGLPTALQAQGLDVLPGAGWEDRGRPGTFTPVGVLLHDTVGAATGDAPSLDLVTHGRQGLSGPLYHVLIARSGTVHLIAGGRANHAGLGGPIGPVPRGRGNEHLVGVAFENAGGGIRQPYTTEQLAVVPVVCAVVLDVLGVPRSHCWGHDEYAPGRKIDPWNLDVALFRVTVAATPPTTGAPTMGMTAEQQAPYITRIQTAVEAVSPGALAPFGADGQAGEVTASAIEALAHEYQQLATRAAGEDEDAARWRRFEPLLDQLVAWRHGDGAG